MLIKQLIHVPYETFTPYTDDELIGMLKNKQINAISILYDRYAPAIYGAILREIDNIQIAEEILQQTFINVWDNPTFQPRYINHLLLYMLNMANRIAKKKVSEINKENVVNLIGAAVQPKQNFGADFRIS